MSHFKIFILLLFLPVSLFAVTPKLDTKSEPKLEAKPAAPAVKSETTTAAPVPKKRYLSDYNNFSFSYFSWQEKLKLKSSTQEESSWAVFNGLMIQLENETCDGHWGTTSGGNLYVGQANAGNPNQILIPYVVASQWFWGVGGYYHLAYRSTIDTIVSVGPMALYRNIKWPTTEAATSVTSGKDYNVGINMDLKFRLSPAIEVVQSIGALALDATTYWQVGFGFKF